jgi:ABC-type antimicrobial peptide transport system permease subunit
VAIINETFARRFWPDADPIGHRIIVGEDTREIVGVVRDGKYVSLGEEPKPYYFLPWEQAYEPDMLLQVRTSGDARAMLPLLANHARALDPELPVEITTIEEHLGFALLPQRLGAIVLGAFGAIGASLAALGLYAVMSYLVSQRTAEIGIRMALGASGSDVRRMVVRRGMVLAGLGLGLGLGVTLPAGRLVQAFLLGVSPRDPLILAALLILFSSVALAASWLPAARAARLDPMRALRAE